MKPIYVAPLLGVLLAVSANATPVTLQELTVAPYQIVTISVTGFYTGGVYAGINKLLVDSVAADGFCIDPFHFSIGGPQSYNSVPLTSAPKDDHLITGTHMTPGEADLISKLWTVGYSPSLTAEQAAALQIAIWDVVGGTDFHLTSANDYGASVLLANATSYSGPRANLTALTGPGQDFLVARPPGVPDSGTTLSLLAISVFGLLCVRKMLKVQLF
jgi:hypothetical protein